MGKGDFSDLESLWTYVKDEVKDIAKNEIVEKIKDVEQKVIQEVVLDAYKPSYYDRRSEGESNDGLISRDNMVADYVESSNSIYIEMTNDTKGNSDYPNSTNDYIDEIIEYGTDYTWQNSKIYKDMPFPRPFTKETQKRLDNSVVIERAIVENLDFEIK